MKRKLTRATIDELRKEMPVLNVEEQKEIIGGGTVFYLDSRGHWWGTGYIPGDNDCIDVNGKVFTSSSGGLNLTISSKGLEISGDGVSQKLVTFFKENTKVEWALSCNQYASDSNGVLNTSYSKDSYDHSLHPGYDTHVHTHPYGSTPSKQDIKTKEKLQLNGYENFYIYYGNEYYPY